MSGVPASTPGSSAPAMLPCQVCGRGPTAVIGVTRNLGLLVVRQHWGYRAPLCRDHGSQLALNWLVATLLMGWWGIISFFTNFGAVATDVRALRTSLRLAPAGSLMIPGGFGMASTASPAAALPRVSRRQLGLVAAAIVIVVGALAVGSVFGSKSAGDLVAGDCFDDPGTSDTITDVTHHPCFQAHTAEVFAVVTYPASASDPYPTEDELQGFVSAQCSPAFDAYTGGGGGLAATVNLAFLAPASDGWASGDRTVICYLVAPAGQTLSQSLRSGSQ